MNVLLYGRSRLYDETSHSEVIVSKAALLLLRGVLNIILSL